MLVTVKADQQPVLFILLTRDGGINRMGNGEDDSEQEMYIGNVTDPIFESVMAEYPASMIAEPKTYYRAPNSRGKVDWEFSFIFRGTRAESGVCYRCGEEGPPPDVAAALRATMEQTEPWYQSFKAIAHPQKSA